MLPLLDVLFEQASTFSIRELNVDPKCYLVLIIAGSLFGFVFSGKFLDMWSNNDDKKDHSCIKVYFGNY